MSTLVHEKNLPPQIKGHSSIISENEEASGVEQESEITRALNEIYGDGGEDSALDPFFVKAQAMMLKRERE